MWRFYIRYQDGNIANCSQSDRANWTACDAVYHRLQPLSQTVLRLYYQRKDIRPPAETIDSFCAREKVPHATVGIIIRSAQTLAAKERGLIDPEWTPKIRDTTERLADRKADYRRLWGSDNQKE